MSTIPSPDMMPARAFVKLLAMLQLRSRVRAVMPSRYRSATTLPSCRTTKAKGVPL